MSETRPREPKLHKAVLQMPGNGKNKSLEAPFFAHAACPYPHPFPFHSFALRPQVSLKSIEAEAALATDPGQPPAGLPSAEVASQLAGEVASLKAALAKKSEEEERIRRMGVAAVQELEAQLEASQVRPLFQSGAHAPFSPPPAHHARHD